MRKEIVPTTEEHVRELAQTIREADKNEVWASSHRSPYDALSLGVKLSDEPLTGLLDGKVVCIFGISRLSYFSPTVSPWMLASDELPKVARTFLRLTKVWMDTVKKRYDHMENYVDCRNSQAIKWLQWMGFKFDKPKPYGPEKLLFCRFELRKDNV